MKKLLALLLVASLATTVFVGCSKDKGTDEGGNDETAQGESGGDDEEAPFQVGMDVIIGQWANEESFPEATNSVIEKQNAHKKAAYEDHDFTMSILMSAEWDGMLELLATENMAGASAVENHAVRLMANNILPAVQNDLCWDLTQLPAYEEFAHVWSKPVEKLMTFEGAVYGFTPSPNMNMYHTFYFNKRMLADAGYSEDYIYDLQVNNEWTWEKFEELCEDLVVDLDNDGETDIYPIVSGGNIFFQALVYANGSEFATLGDDGVLVGNMTTPEVTEAFNFGRDLMDKGYFKAAIDTEVATNFSAGQAAMIIDGQWVDKQLGEMEDDWGMVTIPRGPSTDEYCGQTAAQPFVINSALSKEDANKVLYAIGSFYEQPEDLRDPKIGWASQSSLYRDERVVAETWPIIANTDNIIIEFASLVPNCTTTIGNTTWALGNQITIGISQILESQLPIFDSAIEVYNSGEIAELPVTSTVTGDGNPGELAGAKKTAEAVKGTPEIGGGVIDALWDSANEIGAIDIVKAGEDVAISGVVKTMWDEEFLYVYADVTDDDIYVTDDTETNHVDSDCAEFYIDFGNEKSTAYDTNDLCLKLFPGLTESFILAPSTEINTDGIVFDAFTKADGTGYVAIVKIPAIDAFAAGDVIGFDLQINGATSADKVRDTILGWNDTENCAWQSFATIGNLELK